MTEKNIFDMTGAISGLLGGIAAEYDKGKLDVIDSKKECPSCKQKKMVVVCTPDKKEAFAWWCGNCCTMIVYENFYHWHLDVMKKAMGGGK